MFQKKSKRAYKHPQQHLADLEERYAEIIAGAPVNAELLGISEIDFIEAQVQVDSVSRANCDPELANMLFEMDMEHIKQDMSRDSIEKILGILNEAANKYRAGLELSQNTQSNSETLSVVDEFPICP